ncbi:MAG TPA: hypothetical protein DIT55_09200 [Spirochaetaceae bacterium]|nr:hypothetical protein [Spirochaetaceae bacterium]
MCYFCGDALPAGHKIGFSETCTTCGKDLHVCAMCTFYLAGAHWDCRETIDAPVADKEKRNFCEWFSADARFSAIHAGRIESRNKIDAAKSAFDSLFKK